MFAIHDAVSFLLLAALSVTYTLGLRRIERLRRAVTSDWVPNMLSVWIVAAILTLPTHLLVAAVAVFYAAEWPSRKAVGNGRPMKYLFSWAANAVAAVVSSEVFHRFGIMPGLPLALITFTSVNISIISLAIVASRQFQKLKMLTNLRSHKVELTTHVIGVVLGGAMQWHQPLTALALPLLLVTHLAATRGAVSDAGAFDTATGTWKAGITDFLTAELGDEYREYPLLMALVVRSGVSDIDLVREVVGPCLPQPRFFGRTSAGLLVAVTAVLDADSVAYFGWRTGMALARSSATYQLGVASAPRGDVTDLVLRATADLMLARDRTDAANPGQ